ncbi:MAG: DUF1826 domain-containing protein [Pseudomonadota bacterium]
MSIFRANTLEALNDFSKRPDKLAIIARSVPSGGDSFFQKPSPFAVAGKVYKHSALTDIGEILRDEISEEIRSNPFYEQWLGDMAEICKIFCDIENSDAICFWLGSERGCRRYHTDNVPQRLLVTYVGQGTQWLPDEAADRVAFVNGAPNEKIVKDESALQYIDPWDVAVFRGGLDGLLHRTPDAALDGSSILMRLDHPDFWDNVLEPYQQARYSQS